MLPIKTSPAKETRRRTGLNGSDVGDIEYAQSHHSSSEGSPQKGLLNNAHYPSDKPLVSLCAYSATSPFCHHTSPWHDGQLAGSRKHPMLELEDLVLGKTRPR